jgi:SAM-dependent methyltransferase
MLKVEDVARLRCPTCRAALRFRGAARDGRLLDGELVCAGCAASFEVRRGIAKLYVESEVKGPDRLLRHVYDGLPRVHDPLVRFAFPFAVGETEDESRARYLRALRLDELAAERAREGDAGPIRILEVGSGTGSNVPRVRDRIAVDVPVEFWAIDLSLGMLRLFAERMVFTGDTETRFFAADAHALPFEDASFDRVFHVGAVNGYRNPRGALAEMARVARPGTPIVVVDERLDPEGGTNFLQRLFFRWMTIYDPDPHAPVEALPEQARDVDVEQLGHFFYCLTFSMPAPPRPAAAPGRKRRAGRASVTTL